MNEQFEHRQQLIERNQLHHPNPCKAIASEGSSDSSGYRASRSRIARIQSPENHHRPKRDMAKGIKGKKLGKIVHHLNQPSNSKGSCFSS